MPVFYSPFRAQRAPTARRQPRTFRPSLDSLEGRQLMDGAIGYAQVVSTNGPSVVGEHFTMQAVQSNGLPYAPGTVSSITWTITGALKSRTLDTTGFHDVPFGTVTTYGDTVQGYWDDTVGAHTIVETVNYTQPTWIGMPIPVRRPDRYISTWNTYAPQASESFATIGQTGLYDYQPTIFNPNSMNSRFGVNVKYPVTVANTFTDARGVPYQVNGDFGVIQTVSSQYAVGFANNPDLLHSWQNPYGELYDARPTDWKPYTILDHSPDLPSGSNSPYYGSHDTQQLTAPAGTTLNLEDAPGHALTWDTVSVSRKDSFLDTIVFTPTDGIPVVLGKFQWSWGGNLKLDWATQPGTPLLNPDGRDATVTNQFGPIVKKFTPGSTIPTWDMTGEQANSMMPIRLPSPPTLTNLPLVGMIVANPSDPEWTNTGGAEWSPWTTDGAADWYNNPPPGYPAFDAWGHPYGSPLYNYTPWVAHPAESME